MMTNNRKGSSAVFLALVTATLFAIVFALVGGARNEYIKSRADAVISVCGDSVMSEFDDYVQKEYGLFVLDGRKSFLQSKLSGYIEYSMADVNEARIGKINADGGTYSFADNELAGKQIIDYMKYAGVRKTVERLSKRTKDVNIMENETLRNGETIVSLPTYDMPRQSLTQKAKEIAAALKNKENILMGAGEDYIVNQYVLGHFNNAREMVDRNHFFKNEMEYILGGELSDRKNEKRVEMGIKAIRFPLNLQHIYSDQKKMQALLLIAEVLTPEAAPATQLALASTWAYAESDNDAELLKQGHKVPVIKTSKTWAVDLDNAIEGLKSGIFEPETEQGYDYSQYLQFMMYFMDNETKTGRIMDLIQINTRMNEDSEFVFEENCEGIEINVEVNGRAYRYGKKY